MTHNEQRSLATLRALTNASQFEAVRHILAEGDSAARAAMRDTVNQIAHIWTFMPTTYKTQAEGLSATARLHYFVGGADWWIVEKDVGTEQLQMFGLADLGLGCRELGYISLPEVLSVNAELDFYFNPQTVAELTGRCIA